MKKRTSRNGNSFQGKIKTEHTIIEGLYDILQYLANVPEIQSIIPGKIMRRGSSTPHPSIKLTITTPTGWKAIGKSKGSMQDFFIVTDKPEVVKTIVAALEH